MQRRDGELGRSITDIGIGRFGHIGHARDARTHAAQEALAAGIRGRSAHNERPRLKGRGLSIQRGSRRVERMPKIVIQSMTMRARKARAKAARKDTLPLYGFKNGQPPAEGALSELFRYWKLLKRDFYEPERNSRLKHLIQIGALEIDPPLQPGQRTPKDIGSRRYRVLKRHRLLGNVEPASPPPPPVLIKPEPPTSRVISPSEPFVTSQGFTRMEPAGFRLR